VHKSPALYSQTRTSATSLHAAIPFAIENNTLDKTRLWAVETNALFKSLGVTLDLKLPVIENSYMSPLIIKSEKVVCGNVNSNPINFWLTELLNPLPIHFILP